ncbi:MAG: DnaD domain protein [Candidatus Izemoplasmataceae bacterium]
MQRSEFKINAHKHIDHDQRNVMSLLYLPIIGTEAFSLYFSLYALIDRTSLKTKSYPHVFLFDLLSLSQIRFIQAKEKLEAVGLLESYRKDDEYLYELFPPLSAESFIKDSMFAPYLMRQVGKNRFEELIDFFKITRTQKSGYEVVSKSFTDIFEPAYENIKTRSNYIHNEPKKVHSTSLFNIDLVLEALPDVYVHESTKTSHMKARLKDMAYVYSLDESTLKDLILKSLNDDASVNLEHLSKEAEKHYQAQPKNPIKKKHITYDIEYFKNIHPVEMVEDMTGMHVPASDLKIIDQIISQGFFKLEVVSVLIAYVLKELKFQFPVYKYFEKIIAQWKRNKIETAEDAINYIIQMKTKSKTQQKTTHYSRKKELPEDIKVDWLDDYIKSIEKE